MRVAGETGWEKFGYQSKSQAADASWEIKKWRKNFKRKWPLEKRKQLLQSLTGRAKKAQQWALQES